MSDATTHLLLPYIARGAGQKTSPTTRALRLLDGLVHLSVLDRDLTAPRPAALRMATATSSARARRATGRAGT